MTLLSPGHRLRPRLLFLTGISTLLLGVTAAAHASCGIVAGARASAQPAGMLSAIATQDDDEASFYNPTVVGLWRAIYTNSADNSTFNDSFKTWHIDGTEVESAFLSPAGGNVCEGVWKPTGFRTVKLHHVGWLYNPSTPTATATNYFTVDEFITVAPNGKTYTGTFTFKVFNLDGTPAPVEIKGTIVAKRITV